MTSADRLQTMHLELCTRALSHVICVSICVALVVGCSETPEPLDWSEVHQLIQEDFPGVPSVSTAELAGALAHGRPVVLLDAREPAEFAVSHLRGARRVTSAAKAAEVLETVSPDTLVVAYCSVGYRSAALVAELHEQGVTTAVNLEGSIFAWANEGLPVYRGDIEVDKVHPFDDAWGRLLGRELWALDPGS